MPHRSPTASSLTSSGIIRSRTAASTPSVNSARVCAFTKARSDDDQIGLQEHPSLGPKVQGFHCLANNRSNGFRIVARAAAEKDSVHRDPLRRCSWGGKGLGAESRIERDLLSKARVGRMGSCQPKPHKDHAGIEQAVACEGAVEATASRQSQLP